MKNNFNFTKYLKNNPLLKESRWEEDEGLFFGYDTQSQGTKAPDSIDKKLDRERNAMARNPMVKGLAQALA